jgi:hypothetical protein
MHHPSPAVSALRSNPACEDNRSDGSRDVMPWSHLAGGDGCLRAGEVDIPDTYPGIIGEDLANFVKGVWRANPDFSIDMLNNGEIEPGVVAHHWVVRGTNTGPGRDGSAPTGRKFTFEGASIIHVEGDKIRSDYAYFDRKAIDEQFE